MKPADARRIARWNRFWEWLASYGHRLNAWAYKHRRCDNCGGLMDGPPCHGKPQESDTWSK